MQPSAAAVVASVLLSTSASLAQEERPSVPPVYLPRPLYLPPPRVIPWSEGTAAPPGYRKDSRIRSALVITGATLFGAAYMPTAVVGSFTDTLSVIPVGGPFAAASLYPATAKDAGIVFLLVLDGFQQAAGLALIFAGVAAREPILVRNDVQEARTHVLPVPMTLGPRSGGLGLAGTF